MVTPCLLWGAATRAGDGFATSRSRGQFPTDDTVDDKGRQEAVVRFAAVTVVPGGREHDEEISHGLGLVSEGDQEQDKHLVQSRQDAVEEAHQSGAVVTGKLRTADRDDEPAHELGQGNRSEIHAHDREWLVWTV